MVPDEEKTTIVVVDEKTDNVFNDEQAVKDFASQPHYVQWGVTAFLVIAASLAFFYTLFKFNSILKGISNTLHIMRPIIYGMVLAYLLTPIVNGVERKILTPAWTKLGRDPKLPKTKKLHRAISIVFTVVMLIVLLYLFFASIIPQLMQSIQTLVTQFPVYTENFQDYINKILTRNPELQTTVNTLLSSYNSEIENILTSKLLPMLNEFISKLSGNILSSLLSVVSTLWNLIIGLIVSIYLLSGKEHFAAQSKKTIYSIFSREKSNKLISTVMFIKHTFGDYLSGKMIDSLIIGLICFIGMTCLQLPYVLLISVIVGVTNIIPFFGPYLGAIPSALLILMVEPKQAFVFIIFILILQQFDGNFLGPKILGDSTGLTSFWIIFAITLFGGYFSVLGMAIGVPVFAVLYAGIRSLIHLSLKKKGLSYQTKDYLNLKSIDDDLNYIRHRRSEETVYGNKSADKKTVKKKKRSKDKKQN